MPWISQYDGTVYADDDRRLRGLGNPPADPGWMADHRAMGQALRLAYTVQRPDPDPAE